MSPPAPPPTSSICQRQSPTPACPTPPHRGGKPVSRTCTPNCSKVTGTDEQHPACAWISFSPAWLRSRQRMLLPSDSSAWKSLVQVHAQDGLPSRASLLMPTVPWRSTNLRGQVAQYPSQHYLAWRYLPKNQQPSLPAKAPKG